MEKHPYHSYQMGGMPDSCCDYPQPKPPHQKPAQMLPAQYKPVKQFDEYVSQDIVIPVVHPSHTTQHDQTNYKYIHSYPHTKSVVKSVTHQHFCAPCPPKPPCSW